VIGQWHCVSILFSNRDVPRDALADNLSKKELAQHTKGAMPKRISC